MANGQQFDYDNGPMAREINRRFNRCIDAAIDKHTVEVLEDGSRVVGIVQRAACRNCKEMTFAVGAGLKCPNCNAAPGCAVSSIDDCSDLA